MKSKYPNQINLTAKKLLSPIITFMLISVGCSHQNGQDATIQVQVMNTAPITMNNALIAINLEELKIISPELNPEMLVVYNEKLEIPSQLSQNKICFIASELTPDHKAVFTIKEANAIPAKKYEKRTQAEISVKTGGHFENRKYIGGDFENVNYLRVPDEHTDHSYYIRYEGPGWESDLVGYRFYLDWRNATDVFGKKTSEMILHQVGLDGFDSYHEMQDWGVDVLKVGKSLGIGSLGTYHEKQAVRVDKTDSVTCEILENGDISSAIKTNYYGWKVADQSYDIESLLSIHAGTRLTHHEITISDTPPNLCTGIGKDKIAKLYTDQGNKNQWGYMATYGTQSLNNDKLGLAVLFNNDQYKGFTEDQFSHIVKLSTTENKLDYYFLAAWEGENEGLKDEESFLQYVRNTAMMLAHPPKVSIK